MAKNTVHQVSGRLPAKAETPREHEARVHAADGAEGTAPLRQALADDFRRFREQENAPKLASLDKSIAEAQRQAAQATLAAPRHRGPGGLAFAMGMDADPTETAREAYQAVAAGLVEDPLLSKGAAAVVSRALAAYQGLETAAGATGVGAPSGPVQLHSKRNIRGKSMFDIPVASRPIGAIDAQQATFAEATHVRNHEKKVLKGRSTANEDAMRHSEKLELRQRALDGQTYHARFGHLADLLKGMSSSAVPGYPDIIEISVSKEDIPVVQKYLQAAMDRTGSRDSAPWCTISDSTGFSFDMYDSVPHALYVDKRTGRPVAYRASDLYKDVSLKEGIPEYYDLEDEAHRDLAGALDPKRSKSRVKDTEDPPGSYRYRPRLAELDEELEGEGRLPADDTPFNPELHRDIQLMHELLRGRRSDETRQDAKGGGSFRGNLGPEMSPNAEPKPRGPALAGASETPWTETYAKGVRVLRAARKPLDAVFGEPGSPTKLGRAMDATAEGLGVALMTHGAAATRLGGTRVLRKAGWQKGPFGWGVETRGDATLRPAAVFGGIREGRLKDVAYVHPDVARAYPAMEGVPVKLVPAADWQRAVADARAVVREGSTGFSVRGGNGPIYIRGPMRGEDLGMFSERADRTLVHEMQHIAQDVDGVPGHAYARSNPGYATSAREVEARNSANRRWLTPEERIEMPRSMTQDVRPEDVHLDDKGGDERHQDSLRNFLATDEVPDTLFGIPVVHREGDYTESDLEFFKENPRAAGFYDMGDDEGMEEGAPQQAVDAGDAMVDEPTLSDEGRPMYFFRNEKSGKIEGYGTTRSMVHEDNGKFFVIPTILENEDGTARVVSDEDAIGWYSETGDHWGSYRTREAADAASRAVSARHRKLYQKDWNEYIQAHWDDIDDSVRKDPGVAALHKLRTGGYPGSLGNPGNLRWGDVAYPGADTSGLKRQDFLKFANARDGLNAMGQAVGQMVRVKLPEKGHEFTLTNLVRDAYARKNENDTEKYIRDVSRFSGLDANARLDLADSDTMSRLLEAMVRRDSGHPNADWFTRDDYRNAVGWMLRKWEDGRFKEAE